MDFTGFTDQERPDDLHGVHRSREQLSAGDQKVRPAKAASSSEGSPYTMERMPARVHLSCAHRTWFAARVERRSTQLIAIQAPNRGANEVRLGMRCWVPIGVDGVGCGQHDSSVEHQGDPKGWLPASRAWRASSTACLTNRSSMVSSRIFASRQSLSACGLRMSHGVDRRSGRRMRRSKVIAAESPGLTASGARSHHRLFKRARTRPAATRRTLLTLSSRVLGRLLSL